jgi:hypothetical protein
MKQLRTKWMFLFFGLTLLAACGGGGGGGGGTSSGGPGTGTMTVSIVSQGTTTYNGNASDPWLASSVSSGTLTELWSGFTGSDYTTQVYIVTSGTTTGSYPITGSTWVEYINNSKTYLSSSGTVTLTSVGTVGEPVAGSFQAVVSLVTDTTNTLGISGTFSVIRIL